MKIFKKPLKISKRTVLIASVLVILIGIPAAYYLWAKNQGDTRAWYDSNWMYRRAITVSGSGATLTNEDVLVTIDTSTLITAEKLQNDCGDLRFLDSDDSTLLSYWIEDDCNTPETKVWVRIPSLPAGGKNIYIYYGNPTVSNGTLPWTGNINLYSDTSCPAGWTRNESLDGKFVYGSNISGTSLGSSSHAHNNASCIEDISTTSVGGRATYSQATGGTITYAGGYTIHKFTSSGSFVVDTNIEEAEVLVVGGGGGGGDRVGGGGGGGGVIYESNYTFTANTYAVTVGAGGVGNSGGTNGTRGGAGGNSSIASFTAIGGGGGGGYLLQPGGDGGSGGGSSGYSGAGGSSTSGQGNNGGSFLSTYGAGGGGGAGTQGTDGSTSNQNFAGSGGEGKTYSISGSPVVYGSGGGGGSYVNNFQAPGGTNAGVGGDRDSSPGSGVANTGGGGGGRERSGSAGNGGSGIVIIRYKTPSDIAATTTTHTHNVDFSIDSTNGVIPPYKDVITCYNNKFTIPQGTVTVFNSTVPTGWTRFSDLDNYFPRSNTTYGATGGASTHAHIASIIGGEIGTTADTIAGREDAVIGGTISNSGGYTTQTFTGPGPYSLKFPYDLTAEVLVVAGGGGGGGAFAATRSGGGGGGGGVVYNSQYNISSGNILSIYVGAGGSGSTGNNRYGYDNPSPRKGENSALGSITAIGGGGGGSGGGAIGGNGGSGGGSGRNYTSAGGQGTAGQGSNGGVGALGTTNTAGGGGGGGAGQLGAAGTTSAGGKGGNGLQYSISGVSTYYGGGGGGARLAGSGGAGGSGGGGAGRGSAGAGTAGTANTGGGGGGGATEGIGGYGGSGIVILKYPTISPTQIASPTHTHDVTDLSLFPASNIPPYSTVIFGEANSAIYVDEKSILMSTSLPPLGWNRFTELDDKYIMGDDVYGTTGGSSTHTHNISMSTDGPSSTTKVYPIPTFTQYYADGIHTHSCSATTNVVSNNPPSISMIFMQRKITLATNLGAEEIYNLPPTAPTDLLAEGVSNPTEVTDLTPEFSAIYNDPDGSGDTAIYYEIEVNTQSNFSGTVMWDTGKTAITPLPEGTRMPDKSYAGTALTLDGTTYHWRIRFWDQDDEESPWSSTAQFTMNHTPTASDLLTEGQVNPIGVTDTTPEFSAVFNDGNSSNTGNFYEIQVNTSSDFTGIEMWYLLKTSVIPLPNGTRMPDKSYAGTALTLNGTTYYWRIRFWDNNDTVSEWSPTAQFTMNTTPTVPSELHTNGAVNPLNVPDTIPKFSAIFNDADSTNTAVYYRIEVNTQSNFGGTVMWNSGMQSLAATPQGTRSPNISYAGLAITNSARYYWRIKFWDNYGSESPWSSGAYFRIAGPPNTPILQKVDGKDSPATVYTQQPKFSAVYTDFNEGDNGMHYEIEVNTSSNFSGTVMWDSGKQPMIPTPSYASSPEITYSGTSFTIGSTYYWRIRFWDTLDGVSPWSSVSSFTYQLPGINFEGVGLEGVKIN